MRRRERYLSYATRETLRRRRERRVLALALAMDVLGLGAALVALPGLAFLIYAIAN